MPPLMMVMTGRRRRRRRRTWICSLKRGVKRTLRWVPTKYPGQHIQVVSVSAAYGGTHATPGSRCFIVPTLAYFDRRKEVRTQKLLA